MRADALRDAVVAALLCGLAALLAVAASWNHSPIYDEPYHLGSGVARVTQGDHRLAADHPPLAQDLAALAALPALNPARVDLRTAPEFPRLDAYAFGRWLLCNDGLDAAMAALRRARGAIACLTAFGVFLVWRAARLRTTGRMALLAPLLLMLDPAWIAHGGLVTTDMAAAVFFFATILAAARAFALAGDPAAARRAGRAWLSWTSWASRGVPLALAFAALCVSKFSAPLVLPALVAMGVAAIVQAGRGERAAAVRRVAGHLLVAFLVAFAGIWAAYGFRFKAVADPARDEPYFLTAQQLHGTEAAFAEMLAPPGEPPTALAGPLRFVWRHRLLPESYVWGLAETRWNTRKRASFLAGECYEEGRAGYFPLAFAVKTPLATQLLLLIAGAATLAAARRRWRLRQDAAATRGATTSVSRGIAPTARLLVVGGALFVITYAGSSLAASINIGHRHLLPLAPWVALGAAAAFQGDLGGAVVRWLRRGLVVWLVGANALAFPQQLGYFHELAGGARGGRELLVDSNVDWGQDLLRLARWQREQGGATLLLSRLGTVPPAFFGVVARELPSQQPFGGEPARPFEPGVYAISATQYQSVYSPFGRASFWDASQTRILRAMDAKPWVSLSARDQASLVKASFGRLLVELRQRDRVPDAEVATSFLIFRIDAAEMADLRNACLEPPR